jgi:hypothetical protein
MGRLPVTTRLPCLAAALTATVLLGGCETTAQRSAELQRHAKRQSPATKGVTVSEQNPNVEVLQSSLVRSSEGTAVVVRLRNLSSHPLENTPIAISVRDARGQTLFQNDQPGLDPTLTRVSWLGPHAETVWVDDQVTAAGTPASALALVGEGTRSSGAAPSLNVSSVHLNEEAGEVTAAGTVTNRSRVTQEELVVYAIARHGSKVVAAGRAILPEVLPGKTVPFQIYFVGDPHGAVLRTSAPPTSF